MHALEVDLFLAPEPGDNLQALVSLGAPRFGVEVECLPLRGHGATDTECWQQASLGENIDRCALFSHQNRIAQRQRDHVHTELQPPRSPGQRRQRRHTFEDRLTRDQPVQTWQGP